MDHKIFVTVQGGVADVCEDTVPRGVVVEVLDFDNLEADPLEETSSWSRELHQYWERNHKDWGRCEADCPCRRVR